MKRTIQFALVVLCSFTLYACAVSQPKRVSYGGADSVGAIDASMVVGAWRARILNPIEGEETGSSEFTFNADGSMSGSSQNTVAGKPLVYEMSGSWQINGERIATKIESLEETSGNQIAAFAQSLVASLTKGRTSSLNVFDASADRLVVVEDDTGQAQEWLRAN